MPLNLANGVEATAEIILKVADQCAIYQRSTEEDDLITNSDNDSILMHSVFDNESRLVFKDYCNIKSSGLGSF